MSTEHKTVLFPHGVHATAPIDATHYDGNVADPQWWKIDPNSRAMPECDWPSYYWRDNDEAWHFWGVKAPPVVQVLPMQRCDGNHPEPPCSDAGCWLRDYTDPVNVSGPAELCPEPAPGLAFDARGVLRPAAPALQLLRPAAPRRATIEGPGLPPSQSAAVMALDESLAAAVEQAYRSGCIRGMVVALLQAHLWQATQSMLEGK